MADAAEFNADQLAFWNGVGGNIWVERQAHTDEILAPISEALLALASPREGERVLDIGCGCGASTIDIARAVGPGGKVTALDISGPMLEEGQRRAEAAGIANIEWQQADAATAPLEEFDLLVSNFGSMFFGDPAAAYSHIRGAAREGARMAMACWRGLADNPWMKIPMDAVRPHVPPRPAGNPNAPGMFAFADQQRVTQIFTGAGWSVPRFTQLDLALDIAAGKGLEEALVQLTKIGAINSWLRGQPDDTIAAAVTSLREILAPFVEGDSVRLPASVWLITSAAV